MGRRSRKKKQSAIARLQEIYDSLPTIECKGRCHDTCGMIPLTVLELKVLNAARMLPLHNDDVIVIDKNRRLLVKEEGFFGDKVCPALTGNRCGAHKGRPLICRLYGMISDPLMTCEHGCTPSRWMSREETNKLINEVGKL